MNRSRIHASWLAVACLVVGVATARLHAAADADPCALLTPAEVESVIGLKVSSFVKPLGAGQRAFRSASARQRR